MSETKELQLTPHQQQAFEQIHDMARGDAGAFMTLEGYAGTGKTTLVGLLLARVAGDMRIAVAAPTNKAVRVLQEKVHAASPLAGQHVEFGSIHSFLGLKLTEREDGTHECRKEGNSNLHLFDLVVVDECSMLDEEMFRMIALSHRAARVLFVGDPAQLPPVADARAISPVFERVARKVRLTEVVRQAADNPIIRLSIRIREAIQDGRPMGPQEIVDEVSDGKSTVGVVYGGEGTALGIAIAERRDGVDARIVAYTNQQVQRYNEAIHQALHGPTHLPFSTGEAVIAHEQCEARLVDSLEQEPSKASQRVTLFTSEELVVRAIESATHPYYPDIPAYLLRLERDDGGLVAAYIPEDQFAHRARVNELFAQWRDAKAREQTAFANGGRQTLNAKELSQRAWAFVKAFAPIRHAYAMTTHKSQGSTIDTVIVDFSNLARMRSEFEFNRALYVAATRAANHLAIVV